MTSGQDDLDGADSRAVDPRRLMVFRTVGREGSLAAAARALGWTQPAVSQHVHRLERDLGLPLITRIGRSIALTEPGQTLLQHADAVAAQLHAADRAMRDLAGLRTGRVRIAAFPSASATLAARAVSTLTAAHPGMDVRLTQLEPPEAQALLLAGDCDVALVFDYDNDPAPSRNGLHSTALLPDPLRIVLPPDHPLQHHTSIALKDLAEERWISGCPRCQHHLLTSSTQAGFTPDIRHSTDDYVVVQALVATGAAVAMLPELALTASRHPAVLIRSITGHPPRRITALTTPGAHHIPAVGAALTHLQQAARPGHPPA